MTLRWTDGFDMDSGTFGPLSRGWNTAQGIQQGVGGRFGGQAMGNKFQDNFPVSRSVNGAALSALAYGVAALTPVLGQSWPMIFEAAGSAVCALVITAAGELQFVRGSSVGSNVICMSAAGLIIANNWYYLEVELVRHSSAGSVNVYLEGALVASASGANTGAADIDAVGLAGANANSGTVIDDVYLNDTDTALGPSRIETLYPTADTAQKDWAPLSGSDNYAMVNNATVDGDSSYVSAATAGDYDLYDFGNLSSTPLTIHSVQSVIIARKDDATAREVRANLVSGGTTANGTGLNTLSVYARLDTIYEEDPHTSAAWAAAAVNALQLGPEVVL